MKRFLILQFLLTGPLVASPINVAFTTIGNPGNPNDADGLGAVSYVYNIGVYDITASQYTAFLNSVAATDPYGLYNVNMATDPNVATISQSGTSGNYTYSVIGTGNQPVSFVGWFDAARFANWMHNGQPKGLETTGTTETGAYSLNGATSGVSVTKNSNARYWIPTENEWYKAAYYDPTLNGTGGYWLYPTQSNTPPGNQIGSSPNQANIYTSSTGFSVTQSKTYSNSQFYLTDVGTYSGSASHYGTFDQGGDISQWNDTINGTTRDIQGGSWPGDANFLKSSSRTSFDPTGEREDFGFRIAGSSNLTFSQWEAQPNFFTTGQLADPSISGTAAAPESDGIPNLLKYLYNINPAQPMTVTDRAALAVVGVPTITGTQYLTLTYRQFGLMTGITVHVQTSADLATWSTVTPDIFGQVGTDTSTGDPIMQVAVKTAGAPKLFIRLQVTMP